MKFRRGHWYAVALGLIALAGGRVGAGIPDADQQAASPAELSMSRQLHLAAGVVDTTSRANLLSADARIGAVALPHVVQLQGPLTAATRRALAHSNIHFGDYLPDNAFIARLDDAALAVLRARDEVAWVGTLDPAWKRSPQIGRQLDEYTSAARRDLAESGRYQLIITLHRDVAAAPVRKPLAALGLEITGDGRTGKHAELYATGNFEQIEALTRLPEVQYVEEAPVITYRNNTNRWIVQSEIQNDTPLYDAGIRGAGQIVGLLDGPPDQDHCSLDDGKILAYNTADGNQGHGTHVACTIAGDAGAFDSTRGVAYEANLVVHVVPSFTEVGVYDRLQLHHDQGARVHNNSWGDDGTIEYNGLCRGYDAFHHDNEDDLAIIAITNGGALRNPENSKNPLAVGASQDYPNTGSHCSGGIGPTIDSRRKPDLYAPGCGVLSATPSPCSSTSRTGTSMAAAVMSGAATLVRQYYTDGYYPTGDAQPGNAMAPSGALLKATLVNASVDMDNISGFPSNLEGWGHSAADNALYFTGDTRQLLVTDIRNAVGLSTGQAQEFFIDVTGATEQLRVTIAWTDVPAAANTGFGLAAVNDLDLTVETPTGDVFKGNFFSGGVSALGGTKDSRNNLEQVHVSNPAIGQWIIRVEAAAVNDGPQGFALVTTGQVAFAPADCNANGTDDLLDIAAATSQDCNFNGVPDDCEDDCNANGRADVCDIAAGTSLDTDSNGLPDECAFDCNGNGTSDLADIALGTSGDCNTNSIPDECEVVGLIVAQPADATGCSGGVTAFSVGAPAADGFVWYKDGVPLLDGPGVQGADTDTLVIDGVTEGDAALYTCDVLSGCLSTLSASAQLEFVQVATITADPTPLSDVCTGDAVTLSVVASETEDVVYRWFKDGEQVSNGGPYTGADTAMLQINAITPSETGNYRCYVSNVCRTDISLPAMVQVGTPEFLVEPQDACANNGDTAVFTVDSQSPFPVSYVWQKNGVVIFDGGNVSGAGTNTLTVSNATAADIGSYRALAYLAEEPLCVSFSAVAELVYGGCCETPGDLDADGDHDLADMQQFMLCFQQDVLSNHTCSCANVADTDSVVDMADWEMLELILTGP